MVFDIARYVLFWQLANTNYIHCSTQISLEKSTKLSRHHLWAGRSKDWQWIKNQWVWFTTCHSWLFLLTCQIWLVTLNMSLLTCHSSLVTLDLWLSTCHSQLVTPNFSLSSCHSPLVTIIKDLWIWFLWQSWEILKFQTLLLVMDLRGLDWS